MRSSRRLSATIGRAGLYAALFCAITIGAAAASRSLLLGRRSEGELQPPVKDGRELLLVVIGSSDCGFSNNQAVRSALQQIIAGVRAQARAAGVDTVATVGVSVDWNTRKGLAYLAGLWPFDEIAVGRGWLGTGFDRYVRFNNQPQMVPQVLVLERTIEIAPPSTIRVVGEKVHTAITGVDRILAWAAEGALVPSMSRPTVNRSQGGVGVGNGLK